MREAEGVADRDDGLAGHEVARGAEGHGGQRFARRDLEHGHVEGGVGADELSRELAAVGELHADARGALHHVLVSDDEAARRRR